MDEGEGERIRTSRVKELEAMVRKLETENQQLLTKVRPNESSARTRGGAVPGDGEEQPEGDVISLSDVEEGGEDDWLFVSPAKPPTPIQRRVTPAQWLSEGHSSSKDLDLPSLDEVRQSLSFHMTEAENLSMATSGASSLPLRARQPLTNRTARRYLDQVKLRRHSPTNPLLEEEALVRPLEEDMEGEDDDVPVVKWRPQADAEEDVPVIKWRPQANAEEDVPVIKWRPQANAEEDVPVIKWRPQANAEEDVPVIKWRPQANAEEDVPVIKWRPQAASGDNDDIPVVKWKPTQPETPPLHTGRNRLTASEDVPVVKWRTPVPENIDEDVPVVRWNSQSSSSPRKLSPARGKPRTLSPARGKPRNVPVRAIVPPGRRLEVSQDTENYEGRYRDNQAAVVLNGEVETVGYEQSGEGLQPPQRVSRFAAHYSSPASSRSQRRNDSSPSHSPSLGRHHSPGGRLPRPVRNVSPVHSSSNLRSRSPSPSVRYSSQTAAAMRSRSPSPSLRYAGQTGQSTSPRLQHPSGSWSIPQKTPSPSGSPLMSRRKLPSPSSPVLNNHTPPAVSTSAGRHPSGLPHPPPSNGKSRLSSGGRAPQQSYGRRPNADQEASSSPRAAQSSLRGGGGRKGLTPPGQGGRQRRMLPTTPSQGGSPLKPPSNKKTSQRLQQSLPRPQASEEDEDSWLEGCF